MRGALVGPCLVLALSVATPIAFAQPPATATSERPLDATLQGPAKDAYVSARILFSSSDFSGAATKYGQAYELSKDPRLLFDVAICEKNLRHYGRTQSLLKQYVHDMGAHIAADDGAAVDAALAAIRNFVGTVRLDVNETGASVSVDGQPAGSTPLAAPLQLDLGKHTLGVKKEGFVPSEQTVDVVGGGETAVSVTLSAEARIAHLLVLSDAEATVSVDEKLVGKGRFDGTVASGTHTVLVTEAGMQPYRAEIDLKDGERRSVSVTLEREKQGALWPWILGGAVVAAGAAVGGYFLFKPSDTVTPVPAGKAGVVTFMSWRP